MADHREPNNDGDGASSSSSFQRTVILRDWWLIKCSKEFEGKRFGVAGTEIAVSVETRAMRVFTSSPIIKAFDVFTLQASDGICITLRGFLNKERVVKSGFVSEISRDFIFGFPPCWEQICNNCFGGVSFGADINTVPSITDKAYCLILSPCKNTKGNLEDSPAKSRDKSTLTETNNNKEVTSPVDGCGNRHSGTNRIEKLTSKTATKESLTSEQQKGKLKVKKTSKHSPSKDLDNSRNSGKKGKSKKSEKTHKNMNHLGSIVKEVEENLSGQKVKRKMDFDVKVTRDKEAKKQETNAVSTDSVVQKRSRSGRVLVSSLEFWRNQIPVYDMDRNLIQVSKGHETTNSTPSKRKKIGFSKVKKRKIK